MPGFAVLVQQLLKMFVYIMMGFLLVRGGILKKGESRALAQMTLYIFLPCTIVNSFYTGDSSQGAGALITSLALGALALVIAMVIGHLIFKKHPIDNFSAVFSNAGFMGIPLISMMFGPTYVIYVAGMVAMLNALQWIYGQMILSGEKNFNLSALTKNPMIIAFALGLAFYFLPVRLPSIVAECLGGAAACNTPLAMILLGLYLGESDLGKIFTDKKVYATSFVRLILAPSVTAVIFRLIPSIPTDLAMVILVSNATPVGSNVAIYAQKLNLDHSYAVGLVCASTVLSILTIPAVVSVAGMMW